MMHVSCFAGVFAILGIVLSFIQGYRKMPGSIRAYWHETADHLEYLPMGGAIIGALLGVLYVAFRAVYG
jgi:hypothetical protein